MIADLIFDVGAFKGEDCDYYLRKGFRVVAVEANPDFAEILCARHRQAIEEGRLALIGCAIAETEGEVEFHVHEHEDWSSLYRTARFAPGRFRTIRVPSIRADRLFREYGTPYYVKVDIEGADPLVIDAVVGLADKPSLVSYELGGQTETLHQRLERAGYDRFKRVPQHRHRRRGLRGLIRPILRRQQDGTSNYRFTGYHSGPFGEAAPGKWMSASRIDRILKKRRESRAQMGWYDVHAGLGSTDRSERLFFRSL